MTTIEKIQAVQDTMEQVAVAGHENWNRMLACWQTLQVVQKELMNHESADSSLQQRDPKDTADPV